jgi:hypothetical protein
MASRLRTFRVLTSSGGLALTGECVRCSRVFVADGKAAPHKEDVRGQFEAHVCRLEDIANTSARIVKRAGSSLE